MIMKDNNNGHARISCEETFTEDMGPATWANEPEQPKGAMSSETLTRKDALNILDALEEWNKHPDLGPKEMDETDCGLDHDRYEELIAKLEKLSCVVAP